MPNPHPLLDVLIVGAGFAGLYQLHRARAAGFSARVLEAGEGIGGTWYWNRYPGARCDVESLDYSYSFSEALQQEWSWTERYATQPEILRYIRHVADRFALWPHIQLATRVAAAAFDDAQSLWQVRTAAGEQFRCRWLVMATGCLSVPQAPQLPGLAQFRGRCLHSADWPVEGVDLAGLCVGLVGTGSSGVQMAPLLAQQALHLTVFQRTASYSVPAQNEPLGEELLREVKAHYAERRARAREAVTGHYLVASDRSALDVSDEERQAEFEYRWKGAGGGFRMLRAFNDLLRHPASNRHAADFVRGKIRGIVRDPRTADLLCPGDELPFGAKRLCVDSGYYETFNRDNVELVDIRSAPILTVTPTGVRTSAREHALDVLVLATGFDAMTGALLAIDIRGRGGRALRDSWAEGPRTYLGLGVAGFPNLFIVAGPGSPSVLSNMVHSIEVHVDWITRCLEDMRAQGLARIEADAARQDQWVQHLNALAAQTLYPQGNSWYLGANVPGKPRVFMPYVAGVPAYRRVIEEVAANGYDGFHRAA